MYFNIFIQPDSYIIQVFLLCLQESYCQYDIFCSDKNLIQYFHVLPSQHVFFGFIVGGFH